MAITGYEVDQVTHTTGDAAEERAPNPSREGMSPAAAIASGAPLSGFACYPSCSASDKSVPIYHAYNHHYFGWLQGAESELFDSMTPDVSTNPTSTKFRTKDDSKTKYPTYLVFKENPGGEYRKSYHGYPAGYATLLHSPTNFIVEPMQIDTHNRAYGVNENEGFVADFLPKTNTENNMTAKNMLSPLIECPCSTRITKKVTHSAALLVSGTCKTPITTASACATAVAAAAGVPASHVTVSTISDLTKPAGCVMTPPRPAAKTQIGAVFNCAAKSTTTCVPPRSPSPAPVGFTTLNATQLNCAGGGCIIGGKGASHGCVSQLNQCTWADAASAKKECEAWKECAGFMCSSAFTPKFACFARGASGLNKQSNTKSTAWIKDLPPVALASSLATLASGIVNASISHDGVHATITLVGPAKVWFGVGFDATQMADAPYAIIVNGATGAVTERKLASHAPGAALSASVAVTSNTVNKAGTTRTVVLARTVVGADAGHWSIPTVPGGINVIAAIGSGPTLAYHAARGGGSINMLPTNDDACVCTPTKLNLFAYGNASLQTWTDYDCVDEPRGDMLRHGDGTGREGKQNNACDMSTYHGGLRCCKHTWFLTDKEQAGLISPKVDTYYLKWRYYFQEYVPATTTSATATATATAAPAAPTNNAQIVATVKPVPKTVAVPASHLHLRHWVFLIDQAVNDYEESNLVFKYGEATVGNITAHVTVDTMGFDSSTQEGIAVDPKWTSVQSFVMTPHCHAPSCIREEFWNEGRIVCNVTANYGDEKYGSTNATFNEADYVAIPPCLFGHQAGLQYPITLKRGTNVTAHKFFNNTYRHLGQMAQWTGLFRYNTDPY